MKLKFELGDKPTINYEVDTKYFHDFEIEPTLNDDGFQDGIRILIRRQIEHGESPAIVRFRIDLFDAAYIMNFIKSIIQNQQIKE